MFVPPKETAAPIGVVVNSKDVYTNELLIDTIMIDMRP